MAQTYSPMQIVFSDQGSVDGSMEYIREQTKYYDGPNELVFLDCPDIPPRSMSALNAHINWIHDTIDADIFILTSADDVTHPQRCEYVVRAFEEHNPAMVLCAMEFNNPGKTEHEVTAFQHEEGFITGAQIIQDKVGGSSAPSWSRDFYEAIGKVHGITPNDVYMSYLASQDRGVFWMPLVLQAYVNYADENNTGLGGVMRAAQQKNDLVLEAQIRELQQYEIQSTYIKIAMKCAELYPDWREEDRIALFSEISNQSFNWCVTRDYLTERKIPPIPYRC